MAVTRRQLEESVCSREKHPICTAAWTGVCGSILNCGAESGHCTALLMVAFWSCRYCTRLQSPSFWGGEVEILILSRMLKSPIYVFQKAEEAGRSVSCICDHQVSLAGVLC